MQLLLVGGTGTLSFNSLFKKLPLVSSTLGVLRGYFSYRYIVVDEIGVDLRENRIPEG